MNSNVIGYSKGSRGLRLPDIEDFASARALMSRKKPNFEVGDKIKIGYETWLQYKYGSTVFFSVIHHWSSIIRYYPVDPVAGTSERIVLDTNGYSTSTTLDRMHRLTPYDVFVGRNNHQNQITLGNPARQQRTFNRQVCIGRDWISEPWKIVWTD